MLSLARTAETLNPKTERETVSYRLNSGGGRTEVLTIPANPHKRTAEPAPVVPELDSAFYFTTAPVDYDGFGTRTMELDCGRSSGGKVWRKIQVLDLHFNWQNGRNGSGFHPTVPAQQFAELRSVFVHAEPEPATIEPAPAVEASPRPQDEKTVADLVNQAQTTRAAEERLLGELRAFDWTRKPSAWKPAHVLYYLETVCGLNVSQEDRTGTDFVNVQNLARAEDQFRRRNTITATVNVNRRELLDSLKTAKKFGGSRGGNKTVSLSVNGSLELVAINNDARFSQTVAFREKTGHTSLTVPESRLLEIANKLKTDSLDLVLSCLPAFDEYVLTVKTESAEFRIPVQQAEDNDAFTSKFPAEFAHNVSAEELLNAFKSTEFATDTESTRYALGGIYLDPAADSLNIVATDSRRLAWKTIPAEVLGMLPPLERGKTGYAFGLTIPSSVIATISDELKRKPAAVVSFARAEVVTSRFELTPPEPLATRTRTKSKPAEWKPEPPKEDERDQRNVQDPDGRWFRETFRTEFVFELPGVFSIRGIPVDGRFPRYRDVIPTSFSHLFDFERAELLNACETILLSTDDESRGVDFEFPAETTTAQGSRLKLLASSSHNGNATISVSCKSADPTAEQPLTITLDPKYVLDYLKRSSADSVRFSIVDPETAILLTAEPERNAPAENAGCVIMPLSFDR